jgi:YspA, cpYpsA-related SLOG family
VRVLVCGGRDFDNFLTLEKELDKYLEDNPIIISGGANGADALAKEYAHMNYLRYLEFPANWPKFGKAAGSIRNQQMIDEGKPHIVIAFPTESSRGTWDMVRRAEKHGIKTIIVKEVNE